MVRILQIVGIIGFFVCLFIMYATNHGVRGIQEYDPLFKMPDMRFHYSVEEITQGFQRIGAEGRAIYQKYLFLDFVFILCFAILMLTVTDLLFSGTFFRNSLFIVCILRALFDILENSFLLFALKNYPEMSSMTIFASSYFTTFKFIMLGIWIFALIIQFALLGILKIQGS